MAPASSQDITAVPAVAFGHAAPDGTRLSLVPALSRRGDIDGGWWPRSRDAGAELPGLITELNTQALGREAGGPEAILTAVGVTASSPLGVAGVPGITPEAVRHRLRGADGDD